jgi:hypothetical protein
MNTSGSSFALALCLLLLADILSCLVRASGLTWIRYHAMNIALDLYPEAHLIDALLSPMRIIY